MAPKGARANAKATVGSASGSSGPRLVSQAPSPGSGSGSSALAARGKSKVKKVNEDFEELLVAQKMVREEKKRLQAEMKKRQARA